MPRRPNSKARPARNRYYRRAKISEYQFRKILWLFALDLTPTQAAARMALSLNAVHAVYVRLRRYFTEAGVFRDFYRMPEGVALTDEAELRFLEFHLARVEPMQGLPPLKHGEDDLHLFESNWRFEYQVFRHAQRQANVERMMYDDLLSVISLCGPINTTPQNRKAALDMLRRRLDERLLWLERNAPLFKAPQHRVELRAIRAIAPEERS